MDTQVELVELGVFSLDKIMKSWLVAGKMDVGAGDNVTDFHVQLEMWLGDTVYIPVRGYLQDDGRYKLVTRREIRPHRIKLIKQFYKSIAY